MVAYSFKARFAPPILDGTKPGTIRADRKRHARPGEIMQLYTGMRTRSCKLIMRAPCTKVWPVRILLERRPEIIDGPEKVENLDAFAVSDGFADFDDMARFWHDNHPEVTRFSGVHLFWDFASATDKRAA